MTQKTLHKKPTVLLVDDELFVLRALRRVLEDAGMNVISACTPVEAMGVMDDCHIDVVVADERMPGVSGLDFLTWCAQNHPRTSRILLSGFIDEELRQRGKRDADLFEWFDKPWRNARLVPAVWSAIAYGKLQR